MPTVSTRIDKFLALNRCGHACPESSSSDLQQFPTLQHRSANKRLGGIICLTSTLELTWKTFCCSVLMVIFIVDEICVTANYKVSCSNVEEEDNDGVVPIEVVERS
jgi:hypothetical protein